MKYFERKIEKLENKLAKIKIICWLMEKEKQRPIIFPIILTSFISIVTSLIVVFLTK